MRLVNSENAQLRVEHRPRPGAPTLLLLNSLGASLEMWDEQLEAFGERYDVLRFDARGHGKSTIGDYREETIATLAADALAVLDAYGVARAHLCGVSLGGMIAMHIASHRPDRVLKAVLCNTTAYMPPREGWDERIHTVLTQGVEPLIEGTLGRWFTPELHQSHPEQVDRVRSMLRETRPAGYAACCAAIRDMDQRESIRAITARTLVIGGSKDVGTPPAQQELIASKIADAKLVILDTAHLSNVERPAQFNAAVRDFLDAQ